MRRFTVDFSTRQDIFRLTMEFVILLYFVFAVITECKSQENNPCSSEVTCGKCIQKNPSCAWCSDEIITQRKIFRCGTIEELRTANCSNIVDPKAYRKDIVDLALSAKGTKAASAVQIKPQGKKLRLRPNSPESFSVEFRQAVDYPIDLYYLIDVSPLMKQYKDLTDKLGEVCANNISAVSSDFTIGVGSFLDKTEPSNAGIQVTKFKNPVFRHHVNLNTSPYDFQNGVVESRDDVDAAGSSDGSSSPEGILDAIMQAIVCTEVKWRPGSKKLLVIATGNEFYYAGDRKLSGIVEPNDGTCRSESEGNMRQDYPSLSQINRKIKEHNITVIFAVTENVRNVYANVSSRLAGSSTGQLSNASSVIELIKKEYEAMCSSIEITDSTQGSDNIEISYNSSCLDGENKKRNVCLDLRPEDMVTFNVTFKVTSCPKNHADRTQKIEIKPAGRTSSLRIHLEMICECDCKKPANQGQTAFCSGQGIYQCGVCLCNNGTYGAECECVGDENHAHLDDSECKRGNEEWLCSNRGECRCGKCICAKSNNPEELFYGKYCQCSNTSCRQVNNKICNGHGTCDCGRCKCSEGWSGPDCTCTNSTENCLVDDSGVMCSGHGTCYCGSCKCDGTYYGQFCEDCTSCPGKCEEYGVCVKCVLSSRDEKLPEHQRCGEVCEMKNIRVELVDEVVVNELQERACSIKDEDGCHIFFKFEKGDNKSTIIQAQRRIECPAPPDIVAIVGGTIGSVVIAGLLLLLIWKLLTYVHDRREFAKFERERHMAKWDRVQNPIYIQPTSTFENPAYKRS